MNIPIYLIGTKSNQIKICLKKYIFNVSNEVFKKFPLPSLRSGKITIRLLSGLPEAASLVSRQQVTSHTVINSPFVGPFAGEEMGFSVMRQQSLKNIA